MTPTQQSYVQTLLDVDLTTGTIRRQAVDKSTVGLFWGGRGVAARLLWDHLDPGRAALSPDAPLIFSMGTLTGTNVPMSGRSCITFVSPATGIYCKTNVGGHFGLFCKLSGIDYILIHGASSSPVYLLVEGDRVALQDARPLWGKPVRDTTEQLRESHGPGINVACIGPAGENRVLFASVMNSIYNAAGRGGGGAVMGSKRLKAIVVASPGGSCKPADAGTFAQVAEDLRHALYRDTMARSYFDFGTAAGVGTSNERGTLPSLNFTTGRIPQIDELTSEYWNEQRLLKGRIGCAACIYSCHRFIRIDQGPYAGAYSAGPEYETVSALGSGTGVSSIGALQKANELCNDLGLDTISCGAAIQWAMETFERGLLPREYVPDFDLHFGSEAATTEIPRLIAGRKGIGQLLADGVKRAAEQVGKDSWKWAVHTRGLEQSRVDTRRALGYALAFAVNPRGPDHLHTECLAEFGHTPEARALIREITGDEAYARSGIWEKRPEIVRYHEDVYAVADALGLCAFTNTAAYGATLQRCARLVEALTGIPCDAAAMRSAGRRIVTLERLINLKLGWTNDPASHAPWRLMNEPLESSNPKCPMLDAEQMSQAVRMYHRLHEWGMETGVPSQKALDDLRIADLL